MTTPVAFCQTPRDYIISIIDRTFWLTATSVSAVATRQLWRGFLQGIGRQCGCCEVHALRLYGSPVAWAPYLAVATALFIGITAISLIQFTRPSMIWFRRISRVE